jgi:hypothetical protein
MNFARQKMHTHEITTFPITNQSLVFTENPLERLQFTQLSPRMLNKRPSNEGMCSTSIEKHCSRVSIDHERTNNHVGSLGR